MNEQINIGTSSGSYTIKVTCSNCGWHGDGTIYKGGLVQSANCHNCGCKTLERVDNLNLMKAEILSEVTITPSGNGYFIEIKDQFTENRLAITREELQKIVLYGQAILTPKNNE